MRTYLEHSIAKEEEVNVFRVGCHACAVRTQPQEKEARDGAQSAN